MARTRIEQIGRVVLEPHGEGLGQVARRVDVAEQHVRERFAVLLAGKKLQQHRAGLVDPGHGHGRADIDHDDGVRIGVEHGVHERVLPAVKVHGCPVAAFGLGAGTIVTNIIAINQLKKVYLTILNQFVEFRTIIHLFL